MHCMLLLNQRVQENGEDFVVLNNIAREEQQRPFDF